MVPTPHYIVLNKIDEIKHIDYSNLCYFLNGRSNNLPKKQKRGKKHNVVTVRKNS